MRHIPYDPIAPPRYAYLGPEGTFADGALRRLAQDAGTDVVPVPVRDIAAALARLRGGDVAAALFPVENSVAGGVTATLDALDGDPDVLVVREAAVPVRLVLAAPPGTPAETLRRVASHPYGWAQARAWLTVHLPAATPVRTSSTAAAAAALAHRPRGGAGFDAAICAPAAAERYGLDVVADDIGTGPDAVTRFVLFRSASARAAAAPPPPAPTGWDRTSIVVEPRHGASSLVEVLATLTRHGVQVDRLESRPVGDRLGHSKYFVDLVGHADDAHVAAALDDVHRVCRRVHRLGSYPRAAEGVTPVGRAS